MKIVSFHGVSTQIVIQRRRDGIIFLPPPPPQPLFLLKKELGSCACARQVGAHAESHKIDRTNKILKLYSCQFHDHTIPMA